MLLGDVPAGCVLHGVPYGQACFTCASAVPSAEFAPFSPILPVPLDVPTGWLCPYCKRVYGPQVRQCVICSPPPGPFTGPLPRPKNDPVLQLPAYMASEGAYQIARIGAGFTEVLPGLEASIFLPADDEGKIVAHFRLTPKDGEEHD